MKGMFSPNVTWQSFLDTLVVILPKKSEIVGETFLQLWKCNSFDFIEMSGNKCANTNLHALTKIETFYIVALLNHTDCRFVEYKY